LKIQRQGQTQPNSIKCGSIDGGVGISPVPVNVNFPIPDTPSTGIIYKLPMAGSSLSLNSFRGGYVAVTGLISCGPGAGVSYMFMGAKVIPMPGQDVASLALKLAMNSEALVISMGISGSFPDIGVTGSIGVSV
jgi:hypothetical protein